MDFLFHSLSDKEKEEIKKDAKRIIDSFSEKLSKVKVSDDEPGIVRKDFERDEKEGVDAEEGFRGRMLENAPETSRDFIIAEKKRWE